MWKDKLLVEETLDVFFRKEGEHFFEKGVGELFRLDSDVEIEMHFKRVKGGVKGKGRIKFSMHLVCSRCLEEFPVEVEKDVDVLFCEEGVKVRKEGEEIELTKDELDVDFIDKRGFIDMKEFVEEEVRLAVPLKPLCHPHCKGLCPTCGLNLNQGECSCEKEEVDPRFAPLLELKKKLAQGG